LYIGRYCGVCSARPAVCLSSPAGFAQAIEQQAAGTLPWQFAALLLCFATLSVAATLLYPDVFGAPLEQF
jgi:hypothetical protein